MAQTSAPPGTFSVGRDVNAVAYAPNGTRINLTGLTDFSVTPEHDKPVSKPLNRPPMERYLPKGHRFRFQIDRTNSDNELLFSQIEANWWASGSSDPGTGTNGTLYVFFTEINGGTTTWQLSGCSMGMTALGNFMTDSPVKQTIEGFAGRFQVVP